MFTRIFGARTWRMVAIVAAAVLGLGVGLSAAPAHAAAFDGIPDGAYIERAHTIAGPDAWVQIVRVGAYDRVEDDPQRCTGEEEATWRTAAGARTRLTQSGSDLSMVQSGYQRVYSLAGVPAGAGTIVFACAAPAWRYELPLTLSAPKDEFSPTRAGRYSYAYSTEAGTYGLNATGFAPGERVDVRLYDATAWADAAQHYPEPLTAGMLGPLVPVVADSVGALAVDVAIPSAWGDVSVGALLVGSQSRRILTTDGATPLPPGADDDGFPAAGTAYGLSAPTSVAAGTTVSFRGRLFAAGEPVTLSLHSATGARTLHHAVADASGVVTGTFALPADTAPGAHRLWIGSTGTQFVQWSAALTVTPGRPPLTPATPGVTGAPRFGGTVAGVPGAAPAGAQPAYQWFRDGGAIPGATARKYTPTAADVGGSLVFQVTWTKAGYAPTTVSSAATAKVAAGTLSASKPVVSGTPTVGARLTARPGAWTSGTKLSYQWFANGTRVAGATSASFVVPAARVKARITVAVTGTKAGYTARTTSSAATAKVAAATLSASKPVVSGTPRVGARLTARPGAWTAGTARTYQWFANGKKIPGATASTVVLKAAQAGTRITVAVTGTKAGYTTRTATSAATAAVKR